MIIAGGDRYDKLVSWGGITSSLDGTRWTDITDPFTSRTKVVGIAKSPDRLLVVGDGGWASWSYDSINWVQGKIWDGNFQPMCLEYSTDFYGSNGTFMTAGQGKFITPQGPYTTHDEVAMIFASITGEDWDWQITYAGTPDSRFYSVRRITTAGDDIWIAVGSAGGLPTGIYSLDNGISWNSISFPAIDGVKYAYDVVYNNNEFWFTVNGFIIHTPSLVTPVWQASPPVKPAYGFGDWFRIAKNPAGHMVTVCSNGLAYTTDYVGWTIIEFPAYIMRSVEWYSDMWIASGDSTLTHNTYWTSSDAKTWTPANNGVHAYDFVII